MDEREDIRLREFRQLQREIRGSGWYLVVGLDVAKEQHHAFFGTATGKTLWRRLVFDNSREGFERLIFRQRRSRCSMDFLRWYLVWSLRPTIISPWGSI